MKADQNFTVRLDNETELNFFANRRYNAPEPFEFVEIINESGNDLTFQVEIGSGRVESDDVTINGEIKVINGDEPNQSLNVKDAANQSALIEIINAIKGDKSAVQPYMDLTGAVRYQASNSTTPIVSAAENTNGVIVYMVLGYRGGAVGSYLEVDGLNYQARHTDSGTTVSQNILTPFKIPPGVSVNLISESASYQAVCLAEILIEVGPA